MPKIEIDSDQLDAALEAVSAELSEVIKGDRLAKSAEEDAPAEESSGSEGPAAPVEEDAPPAMEAAPEEESAPMEEPASEEQVEASAAPDGAPEHEAGEIEPAPTVEELQGEYAKLDPEALKMHYLACKQAIMQAMGQADEASAPAAPAPMAPPPAAAPAPAPAPMAMSEKVVKEEILKKSEKDAEIEALKLELASQSDAMKQLAAAMEKVATPIRKSIKGVSDLKFVERTSTEKTETRLSPAEIKARLSSKLQAGKLSKSDKELALSYACGNVKFSAIEHLIVDAK